LNFKKPFYRVNGMLLPKSNQKHQSKGFIMNILPKI